jgi:hypothetical protein
MDRIIINKIGAYVLATLLVVFPIVVFADGIVPCGDDKNPCTFNHLIIMANTIISFLITSVAIPISAALFAWAGFLYLTAAGDEGKIKKAHDIFLSVFIGLIIALSSWLIVSLVTKTLTGQDADYFLSS